MQIDKKKLALLIAGHGMTQAQVADRAGISRANVSKLVKRGGTPHLDTLGKLAGVFGVKPSEMMDMLQDGGG